MNCISCQEASPFSTLTVKDQSVTGETFSVNICKNCQLGRTILTDNLSLDRFYSSDNYISHTSKGNNLIQKIYLLARRFTLRGKIRLVRELAPVRSNLLDIGCGTGAFLSACKSAGYYVTGVEPGNTPRNLAEQLLDQRILSSLEETTQDSNQDLVTLWHVLEHVLNPIETLQSITQRLKPTGKILVAVPNHLSADSTHYKEYWAGLDVPRHLWHFSRASIANLSKQAGLKVSQIKPMKLDSYYVSLLSEQYKGSHKIQQWTNGAWNGLQSNIAARKTGEWSSLIYILEK